MGTSLATYLRSVGDRVSGPHAFTLKLSGALAEFCGGELFNVFGKSCADVAAFLRLNFDGVTQFIREQEMQGVYWLCRVDGMVAGLDYLHCGVGSTVEIFPAYTGSGTIGKILIGAALIGASFFIPAGAAIAIGATQISLSSIALSLGLALTLGGLASLLTPKPGETKQSTSFGGALSRTQQGRPIPIAIGESYINLAQCVVLSAGVDVSDRSPGGGGTGKGGFIK